MNINTEKLKQNFAVSFDGEEGMVRMVLCSLCDSLAACSECFIQCLISSTAS